MTNKIVQLKMLAGGIAHIEIDTPNSKLNVLSQDFFAEFEATLTELEARIPTGEVRGLVISSAKEDNFFAGADVKEIRFLQAQPSKQIYDATMHGRGVFNRVNALPYPTVAASTASVSVVVWSLVWPARSGAGSSNCRPTAPPVRVSVTPWVWRSSRWVRSLTRERN